MSFPFPSFLFWATHFLFEFWVQSPPFCFLSFISLFHSLSFLSFSVFFFFCLFVFVLFSFVFVFGQVTIGIGDEVRRQNSLLDDMVC